MQRCNFTWEIPQRNNEAFLYEEIQLLNQKVEKLLSLIYNFKPNQKEFLTRQEVAKMCNIKSLATLWNWEQKGKLVPTLNAGKKPLYKREDVINFLKNKSTNH